MSLIWSGVLAAPPGSEPADFFAAGGNSLRLVLLLAALEDRFGVDLTVEEFLDAPSVAGIASVIRQKVGSGEPIDRSGAQEDPPRA